MEEDTKFQGHILPGSKQSQNIGEQALVIPN